MESGIALDLKRRCLVRHGQETHLRKQVFKVLEYLIMQRPDEAVSRQELLHTLWPNSAVVANDAVDHCVAEIRRAVGEKADTPTFLETVRGYGYRFIGTATPVAEGIWRLSPQGEATPSRSRLPWNVPYYRNPFFTGRKAELQALYEALHTNHAAVLTQPQAISGLGGIGKSQTAIEYAYQYGERYDAVFWIRADTELEIRSGFVAIATLLGLPEADAQDPEEAVMAVQHWLTAHGPWLLIFDNADRPEGLRPYLPRTPMGHILLTSRASNFDALGIVNPICLEPLSPKESLALLLARTGRSDSIYHSHPQERRAAEAIAEEIGHLPLALDQAGAFMRAHHARFHDYWQSYQQRGLERMFPPEVQAGEYPASVLTTWDLNFHEVKRRSPAAADLLQLSAFLHPDNIPFALITYGVQELGTPLSETLAHVTRDPLALHQTLEPLTQYSLIRPAAVADTFSIHRLVQAVLRSQLSAEDRQVWAERSIRAVCRAFERATGAQEWTLCELLLPHADVALRLARQYHLDFRETRRLEQQLVAPLYVRLDVRRLNTFLGHVAQRNHVFLVPLLRLPVAAMHEKTLRAQLPRLAQHQDGNAWAEAMLALAFQYFFSGKMDQAYQQFAVLLHHTEGHADLNPAFRLLALPLQANIAIKRGALDEAERLSQQCLHEAPETFMQPRGQSQWTLGEVQMYRGNLTVAAQMIRQALDLGQDYPAAQVFCHATLGLIAAHQNCADDARQHYERAVAVAQRLGPFELGHACLYAGKAAQVLQDYDAAQRYLTQAQHRFRKYRCRFHETWCDFERWQTHYLAGQCPDDTFPSFLARITKPQYARYFAHWLHACSTETWRAWLSQQIAAPERS